MKTIIYIVFITALVVFGVGCKEEKKPTYIYGEKAGVYNFTVRNLTTKEELFEVYTCPRRIEIKYGKCESIGLEHSWQEYGHPVSSICKNCKLYREWFEGWQYLNEAKAEGVDDE